MTDTPKEFDPTTLPLPPTPEISTSSSASESHQVVDEVSIPIVEKTFENSLDDFFILSEQILSYSNNELLNKLKTTDDNPLLTSLKAYCAAYNVSDKTRKTPLHKEKFTEIYMKCRPFFVKITGRGSGLGSLKIFTEWLSNSSSLFIQLNEKSKSKIMISAIARTCVRIHSDIERDALQAQNAGDEDTAAQYRADPANHYLQHFVLHLFRIFYHCADNTDRNAMIGPKLREIEKDLHIESDENSSMGSGISDLVNMASGMVKQMGIKNIPDNFNINSKQFRHAIKDMTKNPQVNETLKSLVSGLDLKNPQSLSTTLSGLMEKMGTMPTTPEAVQKAEAVNLLSQEDGHIKKVPQ